MNHGILGYERADDPGAGVWRLAETSGEWVALFAPRSLERQTRYGQIWRRAYVRSVGNVTMGGSAAPEEYGRYEPEWRDPFCAMCWHCLGYPGWFAVAASTAAGDEEPIRILSDFMACTPDYLGADSPKRIGPSVQTVEVEIRWAYLLGLFIRLPISIFVGPDPAIVKAAEELCLETKEFEVLDRW